MKVTTNQTRKRASVSNSAGNAIESILFLVCVVILFLILMSTEEDGLTTLLPWYLMLNSDQRRGVAGSFIDILRAPQKRVWSQLVTDKMNRLRR